VVSAAVTIAAIAYAQVRGPDGHMVTVGSPTKSSAPLTVVGDSAYTGFNPQVYGFHFVNYFTGQILIDIPLIGMRDLGPTSYGLCGGMSYSALDNFIYRGQIPNDTSAPVSGTSLRSYLYDRQHDTFVTDNAWMIRRFIEWVAYPDTTTLGVTGLDVRSFGEFLNNIRPQLAAGHPVTLGLVKARPEDLANLQENAVVKNHQVLAIGYDLHNDAVNGTHWDIRIYDPNFPDRVERMHTHSNVPGYQTDDTGTQQTDSFRGFFATPYSPKQPYWVSGGQAGGAVGLGKLGLPGLSLRPCCGVTAIDQRSGVVTARENARGRTFQFTVTNAALLRTVRIGQEVYANFTTQQVSLDGRKACCAIVNSKQAPVSPKLSTR
jgi:hypothetical protein